jgi:hypothetical protein
MKTSLPPSVCRLSSLLPNSRHTSAVVARIMAEDNLLRIRRRRLVLTTDSKHDSRVYVNLAARMELSGIDQCG